MSAVASIKQRGDTTTTTLQQVHPEDYVSEDEQVHHLEATGEMRQVIGSQSILSQELHNLDSSQESVVEGFSQDMGGGFSQISVRTTATEDFNSQQLAHQYGLLSQDPAARAVRTGSEPLTGLLDSQKSSSMTFAADSQGGTSSHGSSQGGFGTLLDAVQIFQSQEEEEERELKRQRMQEEADSENGGAQSFDEMGAMAARKEKKARSSSTTTTRTRSSSKNGASPTINGSKKNISITTKKPSLPLSKNNSNNIIATPNSCNNSSTGISNNNNGMNGMMNGTNPPARKRKRKDDSEQIRLQKMAQRAADLAQRTINDPELAKRLLLSMALTRENPRSAPETLPGPGHVLPEGFFWAHYPPLEKVLKDNMAEYYELSITKCQSAQQQSFNNELVDLVRAESNRQGWLYAPCFTDKNLRDRIRCYYKTHIQNAKKRLRTMVKNPTKRANARHLCSHLDMIEENVEKNAATPPIDPKTTAVITHQDWGSAFAGETQEQAALACAADRAASFEARVAASVANATKTINEEVAANKAKSSNVAIAPRPDSADSAELSGAEPVLSASMLIAPPTTPAPSASVAAASATVSVASSATTEPAKNGDNAGTVKGDPIAAEAVLVAAAAMVEQGDFGKTSSDQMPALADTTAVMETPSKAPVYESPYSPAKSTASEGEVLFV